MDVVSIVVGGRGTAVDAVGGTYTEVGGIAEMDKLVAWNWAVLQEGIALILMDVVCCLELD